ncbi:MAG: anaerobic glycerol-3-phosphate dehydrogenase subunit C, partial [Phycisphaerae bacterium]
LEGKVLGDVLTDRISLTAYATAACIYRIMPLAVVVPKGAADVASAVRVAGELGVPVIARGAGSGLAGQALGRGIVLDFTKYMNRVLAVDAERKIVRVQPGAVTGKVNEALAACGLMLGPDPSSEPFCTVGGNLGNNASGSRGMRYGSMKEYVAYLDVVLADGSEVRLEPMALEDGRAAESELRGDLFGKIVAGTRRLVAEHADLIRRYEPHTSKNSAGYNLFEAVRDGRLDLARLVVGSEGTLAVIVEAGLRVVPKPRERASVLLWFTDLEKAGEAVHHILRLGPSACEIMERHFLDIVRAEGIVSEKFLPKEADTVLLVEQLSDSRAENEAFIAGVRRLVVDELGLAFGAVDAYDPQEQENLWQVRKRAVQILQRLPGPRRVLPFIEDITVPPDKLVAFIRGLREVLKRSGAEAAVYGHAGDSNLHARPMLDTRAAADVERMRAIADGVARLTIDLGGTISCEHGDGLTRSAYLRLQFGPLYDVMRDLKRLWDPKGILNPGKIITDEREIHLEDLRLEPGWSRRPTGEAFDRQPWAGELERCHGCGTCRAYCPVYLATRDEVASPRAKANLLREAIAGRLGLAALDEERMRAVADLCYNCKTCLVECPSGVDVPGLVLRYKEHLAEWGGLGFRDRAMGKVRLMGRVGRAMAPVANFFLRRRTVRLLMEKVGGIGRRAAMPAFSRGGVKEGTAAGPDGDPVRKVAYFAGCFELFNEVASGRAAVAVLEALGCEVLIPGQRCCGIVKISAGDAEAAAKDREFNLAVLAPLAEAGYTIASGCPSCVLVLSEDYPEMAPEDARARLVAEHTRDVHDLVEEMAGDRQPVENEWQGRRLAYHAPCHLRAAGRGEQPKRLLERLLGIRFVLANTTCCGMGGTFGVKAKNADLSEAIAEAVVERIRASGAEAVVTSCGMCRTQLAHGTSLAVYHPMELLAAAMSAATRAGAAADAGSRSGRVGGRSAAC